MSDETDQVPVDDPDGDDIPQVSFWSPLYEDDDVNVGDPGEPEPEDTGDYAGLSKDELAAKLQATEEQLSELRSKADAVDAMRQGIEQLGDRLQGGQAQPAPQKEPGETEEEFRKRLDEQVYEKGFYESMMEFNRRKIGPILNQQIQNLLFLARRDLERDPERAETYKKYRQEIDAEVAKNPNAIYGDPEHLIKIHDQVTSRHQPEIIESRVSEMVEAKLRELGVSSEGTPKKAPNPQFSESGVTPPQQRSKSKPKPKTLTPREDEYRRKIGLNKGDFYAFLERNPETKKQINEGGQ